MNKLTKFSFLVILTFLIHSCESKKESTILFVGSFTDKKPGKGIHVYEFNNDTGESTLKYVLDSVTNTSFLKLSEDGEHLYSVMDSQMSYNGKIASFTVDVKQGKIDLVNVKDCGGLNPAHIEIDKTGTFLASSQYSDGSLSLLEINKDGSLNPYSQVLRFKDSSVIKSRQEASHIHSANFSPDNNYLFAHDLGADKIRTFRLDVKDQDSILHNTSDVVMKSGSGPRHFTFHPNGKFGYSISELSGKITAFNYHNGDLEFMEDYSSYQKLQEIYRAADIHISLDGKFLYVSNRGPEEDSISIFSIDMLTGKLRLVGHEPTYGKHPRNFTLSPCGNFLLVANQFSGNIVVFSRDVETGKLTKLPNEILVDSPSSLQMHTYRKSKENLFQLN
ncbi:lactonase family protein [Nonlabens ulvanivorans]|uniref:6-phosphogluconolactonase n=1 Tax=Nonlabens ulvanivorans TaxID=906888 RepID=A0ABX5E682_NONUL|nr:lactonase family protein [Nonlabens ulvanivorans]PRX13283.1 6-phosphogluconolactonase [Nonlabens ulvanivorans]